MNLNIVGNVAEFDPAQFIVEQMFHQNPALQRRARQGRILAAGRRLREHSRRQSAEEEASGSGTVQEEQQDDQCHRPQEQPAAQQKRVSQLTRNL